METRLGVEQEFAAKPKEHGDPGFGFALTIGVPWNMLAKLRGGADVELPVLVTVCDAMNGTEFCVLLMLLSSG
jgi:hypothetical protein